MTIHLTMEFIVSRNSLLQALRHTWHAILKRNALPPFKNYVLTFSNDCRPVMTVHTSNGEIWMTEDVVLDGSKDELHPIAIYYNDLLSAIKALDEQPLRFVVGEYQMTVYHEIGSFRLPLANNAEEFLSWHAPCPDVEAKDCHSLNYEAPALASILNRCSYAMSQDDLRPVMNGVHINLTEDYSDYVASDGHVLVRVRKQPMKCNVSGAGKATNFIFPSQIVRILRRVLPKTGDVDIDYQEKREKPVKPGVTEPYIKAQCRITIDGNMTVAFNPVDGRYPNYLSVFPVNSQYEMLTDRRALIKSLDRLVLFANESIEMVRMTVSRDKLKLRTEDREFSLEGEEELPCECNMDTDVSMTIGMQATRLSKTLKTMTTEKVAIHIEDSSRAVIITPQPQPDNEELTYLIMPMLCNDNDDRL